MTKARKKYVATVYEDDAHNGEVRFGGAIDEYTNCWEGGQLIFKWEQKSAPNGMRVPARVQRIVDLANVALETHWSSSRVPPKNLIKKIIHKAHDALHWYHNAHVAGWGEKPAHGQFARAFEEHDKFRDLLSKLVAVEKATGHGPHPFKAPDTLGKHTGCTVCGFVESYHG